MDASTVDKSELHVANLQDKKLNVINIGPAMNLPISEIENCLISKHAAKAREFSLKRDTDLAIDRAQPLTHFRSKTQFYENFVPLK